MRKLSIIVVFLVLSINVSAEIDFEKDHFFYEKACSKKAGYFLNKKACDSFIEYEEIEKDSNNKIKHYTTTSNLNAEDLAKNIREMNNLLLKKEKQIEITKKTIKDNKAKIKIIEKNAIDLIEFMQYSYDENQVIDVIMGSTDFLDLMTKVDGLSTLSKYNYDVFKQLNTLIINNENKQKKLNSEIKSLKKIKTSQSSMLIEFQRKEANIYNNMQSGGTGATYNYNVDKVDLNKITDKSDGWQRPLKSGSVSSIPWSYSGGGWHPAIDIATPIGSNVIAPANGVMIGSGEMSGGYGKHIVVAIKKGDYIYTMIFAHLSGFADVTSFKKGDVIAKSGNTGMSTGPHVHVEVFRHNTSNLKAVVKQYKNKNDYWFGLGYDSKGDSNRVLRLKANELFNLKNNQTY